jgi:hypothetical protein
MCFRAQADWTFILLSELPTKELLQLPKKMPPQAYQTSQYVVPGGGIFLGKWRSNFAGSSDGKINDQSACALNTLYIHVLEVASMRSQFLGKLIVPDLGNIITLEEGLDRRSCSYTSLKPAQFAMNQPIYFNS